MLINRSVRVSSNVDLVPRRAATNACTRSSGCSSSSLNSASDLANAHVSFPLAGLSLVGGVTPIDSSSSANLGLLIRISLCALAASSSCVLRSLTSLKCCSSNNMSSSNTGSENMRVVMSIILSSLGDTFGRNSCSNLYVSSTSFLQYSPYCARSRGVKSIRRLPNASSTSFPLTPR